jgi:hypothetical protein
MRRLISVAIVLLGTCLCANAQWLNNKMPDAPRTPDGKINMTGPVGRINGKPDLQGIWQVIGEARAPGALFGIGESENSRYFRDILSDFKRGEEPLTPEGAEILRRNTQPGVLGPNLKCLPDGVPHADLLPEPFKIIQTPREIVILYEVETIFRQIFMDGRPLVIDTMGFNTLSWLDARGHGHSEDMRVQERFHRRDFGHMDVSVTITDPKVFTKPITINFVEELLPDTDLFEHICAENERDSAHQPGRSAQ